MTKEEIQELGWDTILKRAVNDPGLIHEAYSSFHNFSIGNQILAMFQCLELGISAGPIDTFLGWKEKGRYVKRGEKALYLWQPFAGKKTEVDEETGEEKKVPFLYFKLMPRWFVVSQTDGEDAKFPEITGWDLDRALADLEISNVEFTETNGNIQGVAYQLFDGIKKIAVSPIAVNPMKTAVHEIAHVLHGHIEKGTLVDREQLTHEIAEVEAEGVALIVIAALGLPGEEYSRGYIQHWWGLGNEIPEDSARRIFSIANKILEAGRESNGPKTDSE